MIDEDYVDFETAKLLKEKGFDGVCRTAYETITNAHEVEQCSHFSWGKLNQVKRPNLQMALKWLREVHNIHIAVIVAYHHIPRRYEAHIMKLENIDDFILNPQVDFASYEEACEAGIRYCLENLI